MAIESELELINAPNNIEILPTRQKSAERFRSSLNEGSVFHKAWYFLRTYVLTVERFDLFLQGTLLIVVLMESNAYLLLRRDAGTGYIPAVIEDWVQIGSGCTDIVVGTVAAWYGRRRRQFSLAGWLATTAGSGLLVLAFPFAFADAPNVELCGGEVITTYNDIYDPLKTPRTVFLILTVLLCALTRMMVWAHGITYLDDHQPQNGPYFYGILISIRMSLGLSGPKWLKPGSLGDTWWHAQLSLALITLMFSVLFTLFPRKMREYKEVKDVDDDGLLATLKRLKSNKAVILQTLALALLSTGLFGFIQHDIFYVQGRFHIEALRQDPRSSRTVSEIFRSLVIIFFVMVFRVRFSVRRSDGVKANTASKVGAGVTFFVALVYVAIAVLRCDVGPIAGVEMGNYEQPECSNSCTCNSERYGYSPVCALDSSTTYFSPCQAGCVEYENLNGFMVFQNCSCGLQRMTRGSCTIDACRTPFTFYVVLHTLVLATGAAAFLMQSMVMLRAVRVRDKATAVGLSLSIVGFATHVLGHRFYMWISHYTCAFFNREGNCVFHHPSLWGLLVASAILTVTSSCVSFLASRMPGDRPPLAGFDPNPNK